MVVAGWRPVVDEEAAGGVERAAVDLPGVLDLAEPHVALDVALDFEDGGFHPDDVGAVGVGDEPLTGAAGRGFGCPAPANAGREVAFVGAGLRADVDGEVGTSGVCHSCRIRRGLPSSSKAFACST
jgi:hypothetical protein